MHYGNDMTKYIADARSEFSTEVLRRVLRCLSGAILDDEKSYPHDFAEDFGRRRPRTPFLGATRSRLGADVIPDCALAEN